MTIDDETLRHYLLGRLSDEEDLRLEERLLADLELFELAEATEAEILDEYFRDELAKTDCQGLLDRLSASPAGRRRIALAQSLVALTSQTVLPETAARPKTAAVLPFRRPGILARPAVRAAALAAALVGAVVVVWQVQPGPPAAAPPPRPGPASPGRSSAPAVPPQAEASPFVFPLSLDTLRGGGESLPVLKIPAGKTHVLLRLALSPDETFSAYDVSVQREGEDVWEARHLAAPKPPETRLEVSLETGPLKNGIYELKVSGVGSDRSTELVGTTSFQVAH